ncbi:hypothetical protein AVEN_6709-1 [Araneus ventricosus]|uniref:Mariner Mos1 transposase n=1 Tax=Araneus ventricosus TaxID=182803 RepID=A0A4Y2RG04_ARAVE|nr:hypothetical protein AVEN_88303-1 [Araneus ventricosus]GBN74732.1 hypothetical protein AVEN_6709-1 [Araneus ventricosus]
MAWGHTGSPTRLRKARQTLSARKLMVTVFWDAQGILLIEFMTRGTTINSEVYCRMLKKLKRAIQNKRRGLLSSGVVLLHDNARPHTAVRTGEVCSNSNGMCFNILRTARTWLFLIFICSLQ